MSYQTYPYYNPYQQNGYSNGINQLQPQPYNNTNLMNSLKGRPVSSLEEVKAAPVDFDGSLFIFPDMANHKIYTKKINMDGTSELKIYGIENMPTVKTEEYATKEEMDKLKEELMGIINSFNETKTAEKKEHAAAPKLDF